MIILYHMVSFALGYVLDLLLGDPHTMPHPIRLIGHLIGKLEHKFYPKRQREAAERTAEDIRAELRGGQKLVLSVIFITAAVTAVLMTVSYVLHPLLGVAVESVLTYYILAARSLHKESEKVYDALRRGDLPGAKMAVSMIVGRDTQALDAAGVTRAAVETVAENTSDGVIAPMLYAAIGGPILGFVYKAVNTMDSMVGYRNDRYIWFGKTAAQTDDIANFLPARISAVLMVAAAAIGGSDLDAKGAWEIYRRDRYKHASPNSAQTESACAGALGVRLAGDATYHGVVTHKPFIGDDKRQVEPEDIMRANRMMFISEGICESICLLIMWILWVV